MKHHGRFISARDQIPTAVHRVFSLSNQRPLWAFFRTVEGIKFSKRAPIPPGFCTERNRIGFRENGDQATAHWTKNDWFSIKREIIIYDHHPHGKVGSKKMIYPGFDKKERSFNFWSDNFPGNKIVRYIFGIRWV